ncbi:hypothetical protein ILUMI_17994, partial [Ignelater luminosus]
TMRDIRNQWKGTVAPYSSQCIRKSGANQNNAVNEFYRYGKMPNDPHLKCYFSCLCFELKVFSSSGEVDIKKWADLSDFLDISLARKCSNFIERDPCQRAYLMVKCVHDHLSKLYPQ